jgi:hypothetical protein
VSSADPEAAQIGKLIERLLLDPVLRARFRQDPAEVCRAEGFDELAKELAPGGDATHTLELRESRSSLAGVVMAVAAEGMALAELRGLAGHALQGPARASALKALKGAGPKTPAADLAGVERHLRPSGQAAHLERELRGAGPSHPDAPGSSPAPESASSGSAVAPASSATGGTPGSHGGGNPSGSGSPAPTGTAQASGAPSQTTPAGAGGAQSVAGSEHAAMAATGGGGAGETGGGGTGGSQAAAETGGGGTGGSQAAAETGGGGERLAGAATGLPDSSGVSGSGDLAALLSNPRLSLPPAVRALFAQGGADPRLTSLLQSAVADHTIVVGGMESVVEPLHAQAIDIVSVDGQPISPSNVAARDLVTEIAALDPSMRPNEIGTPWPIQAQGFFTDAAHQGRLHLAFASQSDYQPGGQAAGVPGSPQLASDASAGAGGPVAATPAAEGVAQAAAAQISADNAQPQVQPVTQAAENAQGLSSASPPSGSGQGVVSAVVDSGPGQGAVHQASGGYVNPLPPTAQIGRTDMGVDVDLNPGDPIVAPGTSRVLGVMHGWYEGQPYVALQLLDGPMKGHNYYIAEQINVSVTPGQVVQAGQPIAHYAATGTGIEMGWAGQNWEQTLAQATGHDNASEGDHANTPAGLSFRAFLDSLPSSHSSSRSGAGDATDISVGAGHGGGSGSPDATGAGAGAGAPVGSANITPHGAGASGSEAPSGQPGQGTAAFKAATPHERRFHRNTVQFIAAVQPGPESPLYHSGPAGDALPGEQPSGPAGAIGGQPGPGQSRGGLIDPQPGQGTGIGGQPSGGAITVSSSHLTSGQEAFVGRVAQLTGLEPRVVAAWVLAEESGGAAQLRQAQNNNDWLNIGYTDSATYGSGDSIWSNPLKAADATAGWLKGQNTIPGYGTASSGIRAILHTVGQAAEQQMMAIANSGWASSHYNDGQNLIGTYNEVGDLRIIRS